MELDELLYGFAPRRSYATPAEQRDQDWREDDEWRREMRVLEAEVASLGNALDEAQKK